MTQYEVSQKFCTSLTFQSREYAEAFASPFYEFVEKQIMWGDMKTITIKNVYVIPRYTSIEADFLRLSELEIESDGIADRFSDSWLVLFSISIESYNGIVKGDLVDLSWFLKRGIRLNAMKKIEFGSGAFYIP